MLFRPSEAGALKGTRGQIVTLLRRSTLTTNEIATRLGLTHNAVRTHLVVLQREGVVREAGSRRSSTRPAVVYELVPDAEAGFSKAYIPFVAQLVRVLRERLRPAELDDVMSTVGRGLATNWPRVQGNLEKRVEGASALLDELGAPNDVERRDGGFVIRNYSSCMLAQAVHGRPDVCRAMESLFSELLQAHVQECCERSEERPRCCFEIGLSNGPATTGGRSRARAR
jgi:predicted ArsR family transcriptional regulator